MHCLWLVSDCEVFWEYPELYHGVIMSSCKEHRRSSEIMVFTSDCVIVAANTCLSLFWRIVQPDVHLKALYRCHRSEFGLITSVSFQFSFTVIMLDRSQRQASEICLITSMRGKIPTYESVTDDSSCHRYFQGLSVESQLTAWFP